MQPGAQLYYGSSSARTVGLNVSLTRVIWTISFVSYEKIVRLNVTLERKTKQDKTKQILYIYFSPFDA